LFTAKGVFIVPFPFVVLAFAVTFAAAVAFTAILVFAFGFPRGTVMVASASNIALIRA
jgi:hypothetical protein